MRIESVKNLLQIIFLILLLNFENISYHSCKQSRRYI